MKGFILKCGECGKEAELKGKNFYYKHYMNSEGLEMEILWSRQEIGIKCECGNAVNEGY